MNRMQEIMWRGMLRDELTGILKARFEVMS
jgi:hypothetical protein